MFNTYLALHTVFHQCVIRRELDISIRVLHAVVQKIMFIRQLQMLQCNKLILFRLLVFQIE